MDDREKKRIEKNCICVHTNYEGDCGCSDEEDSVKMLNFEIPGSQKNKIHLHFVKESLRGGDKYENDISLSRCRSGLSLRSKW